MSNLIHAEQLSKIIVLLSAPDVSSDIPTWARQQATELLSKKMEEIHSEEDVRVLILGCIRFLGDAGPVSDDDGIMANILDLLAKVEHNVPQR